MSTNASANATSAVSQSQAVTSTNASSDSSPTTTTTTNNAPTSTTPATSATPTTTSQSSPAQTSAAVVTAASPSTTPSTSTTSTAAPAATSSSTFTTQVATTLYSTDPAGSIVYVTTTVPNVVTTSVSSSTGSSTSNSHTSVIVGAVVGGVAGIALLALLLFCIRRRARKDEFDGNFDPDHVVGHSDGGALPNVDLADEVTPFPQSYTDQGSSSMRQYSDSPYLAIPPSLAENGKASTDFYPPGAGASVDAQPRPFMQPGAGPPSPGAYLPPINMYGSGPVDWHTPRPGVSPPPSTVSHNTTSTRAAKEREALGRSGQGLGLGLATPQEAAEGSGDVVVHQDAGRAPIEEHAQPREIPPAYESIRD